MAAPLAQINKILKYILPFANIKILKKTGPSPGPPML